MLAIPLATIRLVVPANSHADAENTSRPTASGIHRAPYPQASTRLANAAASAAGRLSVPAQTPRFFNFMVCSTSYLPNSIVAVFRTAAAKGTPYAKSAYGDVQMALSARGRSSALSQLR